jgi:hypothetical protein
MMHLADIFQRELGDATPVDADEAKIGQKIADAWCRWKDPAPLP